MAQSRDQQHNKSLDPDKPALARQGVTSRALIIGALGASVIGLGAPWHLIPQKSLSCTA